MDPILPSLFLGHGSPMNAIRDTPYSRAWQSIGARIPRPRAVLAVSAHWYVPASAVTLSTAPRTIHDLREYDWRGEGTGPRAWAARFEQEARSLILADDPRR